MDFDMLGLAPSLVAKLAEQGIVTPTPIQSKAIPHAMNGRDVMGLAQTGTGKTAAFGLPMIDALIKAGDAPEKKTVRGLILAPTRELVNQITENLRNYTKGTHLKVNIVVGGASINTQIQRLQRGTDLLVATPGRLIDLLDRKALRLDRTEYLVLDEADQMLDMGFIHALRKIAPLLPKDRQTMLFSATMPKQMSELANSYLTNPIRVEASPPGKPADKVTQGIVFVAQTEKANVLMEYLDKHREELALVFARTKHGAERLMKQLDRRGFSASSIHGNKSQGQRTRALQEFKSGKVKILVATDVAARGLDIPDVRHVYNYEMPNVPDNYVHRIGRTARAGKDGAAVAFCGPHEMGELKAIEKTMGNVIPVLSGHRWEGAEIIKPGKKGGGRPGGNAGGRPGGKPGGGRRFGSKPDGAPAGAGKRRRPRRSGNRAAA